jgi:hypothetical protein
MAYFGK